MGRDLEGSGSIQLETLFQHLPEGLGKYHDKPLNITSLGAEIRTQGLPSTK